MHRERSVCPARRCTPGAAAALLWMLCSTGCGVTPQIQLSREEQLGLEDRAMELLRRAAQSDLDVVCCNAIEALVHLDPRGARPYFREALKSESPMVRFAGCVAVGQTADRTVPASIQKCLRDPDPRVRLAAAFAAARTFDAQAAQTLRDALNDSPDENLRCDAAFLIGKLGDRRALRFLRFRTQREQSTKVLVHIYGAMAELGDSRAVDQLITYAQGDAVSRLIALQTLADLQQEIAREALLYRMGQAEDYLEARLIAARGLGRLGSDAGYRLALDATRHVAKDPTDTMRIRSLAALALGAIGDPRALPALLTLAEDQSDARVQVAACYAICQIVGRTAGS